MTSPQLNTTERPSASSSAADSPLRPAEVLNHIRQKGVTLWTAEGQLHFKAPKGVLTQGEMATLRRCREQIVALLQGSADPAPAILKPAVGSHTRRAPLSYSQLAHWNLYNLTGAASLHHVVCATRLTGRLRIDALRRALGEVVRRHDALRTRIDLVGGAPTQIISETGDCELEVLDLEAVPASSRDAEIAGRIEALIFEPIQVVRDRLCIVRLLRFDEEESVLLVGMEHLISDGVSRDLFLRDLFCAYTQAVQGRPFSFLPVPVQFSEFCLAQRNSEKVWLERHGGYLQERFADCPRLEFPSDRLASQEARSGWGSVPITINKELKIQLQNWCRLNKTTLVMSAFTAYIALVLRWCNVSDMAILYQTDGRMSPQIENTIGYFAFPLFLRIQCPESVRLADLLKRVTDEYCSACEHADFSYLEAQVPRPGFTRNTCFNWLPQSPRSDEFELSECRDPIQCARVPFEIAEVPDLQRDVEPVIALLETEEDVRGSVQFQLNRLSTQTMERFARNYLLFLRALLSRPQSQLKDIPLI